MVPSLRSRMARRSPGPRRGTPAHHLLRHPPGVPRQTRFLGARFVDHPLEQAPHGDTEARRLCLDPGAPLVIEPDAYDGGLCGRHDPLTVTPGVYVGGRRMVATRWWLVPARRRQGWEPLSDPAIPFSGEPNAASAQPVDGRRGGHDATVHWGPGARPRSGASDEDCGDHAAAGVLGKRVGRSRSGGWACTPGAAGGAAATGPVLTVLHRMFTLQRGPGQIADRN